MSVRSHQFVKVEDRSRAVKVSRSTGSGIGGLSTGAQIAIAALTTVIISGLGSAAAIYIVRLVITPESPPPSPPPPPPLPRYPPGQPPPPPPVSVHGSNPYPTHSAYSFGRFLMHVAQAAASRAIAASAKSATTRKRARLQPAPMLII